MFLVFTELADNTIGLVKQNQGHGFEQIYSLVI